MNEVHVVAKRGENEFHRYRYATMGDILKEITPLLGRRGIVIFQSEVGRAMFDDDNVIAVEYAFTVAHVSGETWPHVLRQTGVSTCRNTKGGWDDKSLNKCHTAARKYFLLALFQIPTGDEEDADQDDRRRAPAQVPGRPQGAERCARVRRAAALSIPQAWWHCRARDHEALRTGCPWPVAALRGVGSWQSVLAPLPRAGIFTGPWQVVDAGMAIAVLFVVVGMMVLPRARSGSQ